MPFPLTHLDVNFHILTQLPSPSALPTQHLFATPLFSTSAGDDWPGHAAGATSGEALRETLRRESGKNDKFIETAAQIRRELPLFLTPQSTGGEGNFLKIINHLSHIFQRVAPYHPHTRRVMCSTQRIFSFFFSFLFSYWVTLFFLNPGIYANDVRLVDNTNGIEVIEHHISLVTFLSA